MPETIKNTLEQAIEPQLAPIRWVYRKPLEQYAYFELSGELPVIGRIAFLAKVKEQMDEAFATEIAGKTYKSNGKPLEGEASPAQSKKIQDLMLERKSADIMVKYKNYPVLTKQEAHDMIDELLASPKLELVEPKGL